MNNGGCEQICTSTASSRICSCRTGFTLNSDGVSCDGAWLTATPSAITITSYNTTRRPHTNNDTVKYNYTDMQLLSKHRHCCHLRYANIVCKVEVPKSHWTNHITPTYHAESITGLKHYLFHILVSRNAYFHKAVT